MERIRRSKKRNYTILIVTAALLLTVGYATFAQPLAHRLATILPDNSRFGLWYGDGSNKGDNGGNSANNGGNSVNNGGNSVNNGGSSANNGGGYPNNGYNNHNGHISTKQWDIGFIDAKKVDSNGSVIEKYPVSFDKLFATFYVLFSEPGDSITYEFTVKNKGELNARLDGYAFVTTNNDVFKFKVENLNEGEALDVGKTKKIRITTTYNSDYTGMSTINTGRIVLSLRYVQK